MYSSIMPASAMNVFDTKSLHTCFLQRVMSFSLTNSGRKLNLLTKCNSSGLSWLTKQSHSGTSCQWRLRFCHRNACWTTTPPPATAITKRSCPTHFTCLLGITNYASQCLGCCYLSKWYGSHSSKTQTSFDEFQSNV